MIMHALRCQSAGQTRGVDPETGHAPRPSDNNDPDLHSPHGVRITHTNTAHPAQRSLFTDGHMNTQSGCMNTNYVHASSVYPSVVPPGFPNQHLTLADSLCDGQEITANPFKITPRKCQKNREYTEQCRKEPTSSLSL